MMRVRSKIRSEVAEEQYGFVPGKGTRNAIFTFRTMAERSIEVQQYLHLCFIDYTKALDTIQHEHLIKLLQNLHVDGKDLRIIKNLYWEQTACIRYDEELRSTS